MDYLDVTFNLTDSSYRPFNKTNNEINYIHKQSNHPSSIIKQLSSSVKRRLSKLSSNEKILNDSIPIYQEALIKSSYKHKLTYQKHDQKKDNSQQRKRQIIWFNTPYSKNVTTKVGKFFLGLINKHFPPNHKLHKLFNRNNVKISYILYQANTTPVGKNSETKVYHGICETTFKLRYANHKKLFCHRNRKSDTELSKSFGE